MALTGSGPTTRVVASGDVDELVRAGSEVFSPHRLRYDGSGALLTSTPVGPLSVVTMQYRGESRVVTTQDLGYYAVHLPVRGRSRIRFARDDLAAVPGEGAVFNPWDRPDMHWSADLLQLGVKVPTATLQRHAATLLGTSVRAPQFVHRTAGTVGWEPVLRMMVTAIDRRRGGELPMALADRLADAFLTALVLGQPSDAVDLGGVPDRAPASVVVRATELIEADPAAVWSLARIAEATGASARSLQAGFRAERGMTPTEFVRAARMRLARDRLADSALAEVSVAEIAYGAGFTHLGRFAAEFRRAYGVRPSAARPDSMPA